RDPDDLHGSETYPIHDAFTLVHRSEDPVPHVSTLGSSTVDTALDAAVDLLRGGRFAILTGAGVSTDSGIPDYRGEGAPVRQPMTVQQFLADERSRKRYWAGSHLGWRRFD